MGDGVIFLYDRAMGRHGTFTGGIDLPDEKHPTKDRAVEAFSLSASSVVRVPLSWDGRAGAVVVVSAGQRVRAGERIARAVTGGVDVFAPLAGVVGPVGRVRVACGGEWELVDALELGDLGPWTLPASESASESEPSSEPAFDWRACDGDALRDRLAEGHLVLHRRRPEPLTPFVERARRRSVRTLIVNAMEHQPYVTADHRVLAEHGRGVLTGAAILARAIGVRQTHLAADHRSVRTYGDLPSAAEELGVHLVALTHKYPIGADTILVNVLTRRETPVGGEVMDVGSAVVDAATCLAVFGWVVCGQRPAGRVVTVAGERVVRPGNVYVPWGLSVAEVLSAVPVLHGGPMAALDCPPDAVVGPATDALLAIRMPKHQSPGVCIRCGWCTDYCPARLNVTALNDTFELGRVDQARKLGVEACMGCGVCSYVCPARLPLSQRVRSLRRIVASHRSTGVPPVSRMGVSPMQRGPGSDGSESAGAATLSRDETPANRATGETPVGRMGETPMLRDVEGRP